LDESVLSCVGSVWNREPDPDAKFLSLRRSPTMGLAPFSCESGTPLCIVGPCGSRKGGIATSRLG
jgi:hypothetical protein